MRIRSLKCAFGVKNKCTELTIYQYHPVVEVTDPSGYHHCLFFFSASYKSLYRRKERVLTLENRKTLRIVQMLILGPICSIRAGCISDQQSQSPQTVIIKFFSLKLVSLHEDNDRISLQRAVKAKKKQKCLLWGQYARSGQLTAHDLLRYRYF